MIKTFVVASIAAAAAATRLNSRLEQILAQLGVENESEKTCLSTANRNKEEVDNFYELLASHKVYSDDDFTPDASAIWWSNIDTADGEINKIQISWKRATDLKPKHTLFGKGISPDDIIQGNVSNCWFLAAACSIADVDPGLVEKAFHNRSNDLNAAGVYAVDFYTLGVPHTVVVDDFLPMTKSEETSSLANTFASVGPDQSLWGAILEKAFAKLVGNYLHTSGGLMAYGVRRIIGGPYENFDHPDSNAEDLWKELIAHEDKKDVITAGTGGGNDTETNKFGLVLGHAFSVLGTKVLSNGVRLVKIRNPWGAESFKGDWSDTSDKWTEELKKEVKLNPTNKDGIFYMSIEDYAKQFETTQISYNTNGMHQASFVRLNDDKTGADECGYWHGPKCGRHTMELTSEVDQTVWITAHTWDERTRPKNCQTMEGVH